MAKQELREAVVIDACRTPIGRAGDRGMYRTIGGRDLMVPVLQTIVKRNNLDANLIDDVIMGTVAGRESVRNMILLAGLPEVVSGTNTGRFCNSSSMAIAMCAHWIQTGDADVMIAAGLETMDRDGPVTADQIGKRGAPVRAEQAQAKGEYPPDWKHAKNLYPRLPAHIPEWVGDMGRTAEELSQRFNISKEDSDAFPLTSHQKAGAAQNAGKFTEETKDFKSEIIPITIEYQDGSKEVITKDQCPRADTSLEKIAAVPPAYMAGGRVTAANSCPRSDGAGAVLLMSKEMAKKLGYKPLATFRHSALVGCDPTVMGIGPYPSTVKLLKKTGQKITDLDVIEINEAFSCQVLYSGRMLGFTKREWDITNINGGSVAIGHPLAMTGTRQTAVLTRELIRRKGRWGLATLCGAMGDAIATTFEREDY